MQVLTEWERTPPTVADNETHWIAEDSIAKARCSADLTGSVLLCHGGGLVYFCRTRCLTGDCWACRRAWHWCGQDGTLPRWRVPRRDAAVCWKTVEMNFLELSSIILFTNTSTLGRLSSSIILFTNTSTLGRLSSQYTKCSLVTSPASSLSTFYFSAASP